jgi:spore germination cell wall hydrolase CwlJ-like protein
MKSPIVSAKRKARPFRRTHFAAIVVILGLALALTAAASVVVKSLKPQTAQLPPNLQNLPQLPEVPALPSDPVELALGVSKSDWVLNGFDIEKTVNNPSVYENVSKEEARKINVALPFFKDTGPPAPAFFINAKSSEDALKAQHCLSLAVYYEASSEAMDGQYAVAQVVLNRVRHPAWPNTVCGVVFQGAERRTGCQFSFTCDGALNRRPTGKAWQTAQAVSSAVLSGFVMPKVGHATHYHTDWVAPYWAPSLQKLVQIGTHIFYTWKGAGGTPPAFREVYGRSEAWPRLAAATAPQFGPPDIEPVVAQNSQALEGTGQGGLTSGNLSQPSTLGAGAYADWSLNGSLPNNASSGNQYGAVSPVSPQGGLVRGSGKGQRDIAESASSSGSTYSSAPQATQSARAIQSEPTLESLLPKYQAPVAPPTRTNLEIPPLVEQRRQEKRPRALDGL